MARQPEVSEELVSSAVLAKSPSRADEVPSSNVRFASRRIARKLSDENSFSIAKFRARETWVGNHLNRLDENLIKRSYFMFKYYGDYGPIF